MEMDPTNKVWLPFALLLAVWGAIEVMLKTIEMQNKTRDDVRNEPRVRRMEIFWSDWVWLWLGSLWFLAVFTVVILFVPVVMDLDGWAERICWLASSMPGFAFLGLLLGGGSDIKVFTRRDAA
jgi:hypothetical protein